MKQEATNDDGYENSVNHFDMRAHGQNEQGGKVNQNMMDQHIPTAPQVSRNALVKRKFFSKVFY